MAEGDGAFVTETQRAFLKYGDREFETEAKHAVCRSSGLYPWSGFLQKLD